MVHEYLLFSHLKDEIVDCNKCEPANLFVFIEKYFKMKKSDCKEALEIYKRFLTRVTKIGEFMKLAEVRHQRSLTRPS